MVVETKVNVGAAWKDVFEVEVNVGAAWKEVLSIEVNVGGTWEEVFTSFIAPLVSALANGDSNSLREDIGSSCTVGVKFDTDGLEYEYNPNGTFGASLGTWLDAGLSSSVWVEFLRSGGTQSQWDNRGNNVRYQISVDINWRIVDSLTSGGAETIIGQFRFWDAASGGNILQTTTAGILWSALFQVDPCPLCCFTPWTLITMADGSQMQIISVREGDWIMVEGGTEQVSEVIVRENRPMHVIKFADNRILEVSEEHPLYVEGKGYAAVVPVEDYKDLGLAEVLAVGDMVLDETGQLNEIVVIEDMDYPEPVYTFGNSKFYANGMLVY